MATSLAAVGPLAQSAWYRALRWGLRLAAALVMLNAVAWAMVFVVHEPTPPSEFARLQGQRRERDRSQSMSVGAFTYVGPWTHQPIVWAGRSIAAWGEPRVIAVIALVNAPALLVAQRVVVPPQYTGLPALRGESFRLAGLSMVLASLQWSIVGILAGATLGLIAGKPTRKARAGAA
jgi:hypothetical protein